MAEGLTRARNSARSGRTTKPISPVENLGKNHQNHNVGRIVAEDLTRTANPIKKPRLIKHIGPTREITVEIK